jgi:hypothetical protein
MSSNVPSSRTHRLRTLDAGARVKTFYQSAAGASEQRRFWHRARRGGGFNAPHRPKLSRHAGFLENRHDPDAVKAAVRRASIACGWLIFATHDVCDAPTPYGCTPDFFEDIVRCSVRSGARIVPVAEALHSLQVLPA